MIKKICSEESITLFTFINAVFATHLAIQLRQSDISYGILSSGRGQAEFVDIVGLFATSIIFRTQVEEKVPFNQYLQTMNKDLKKALSGQDYPLEDLLDEIKANHPTIRIAIDMLNANDDFSSRYVDPAKVGHMYSNEPVKFDVMLYTNRLNIFADFHCSIW